MAVSVTIKMAPEQFDMLRDLLHEYRKMLAQRRFMPELLGDDSNAAYLRKGDIDHVLKCLK